MDQGNKILTIVVVIMAGIVLQALLVWADGKETPHRAAMEFSKPKIATANIEEKVNCSTTFSVITCSVFP